LAENANALRKFRTRQEWIASEGMNFHASTFRWMALRLHPGKLPTMTILTEPIGSIPRPAQLLQAIAAFQSGVTDRAKLEDAYANALRDTITRFEQTGSPIITDGEQTKPSFATYPLSGLNKLAADGIAVPFADGHVRQLPRLTGAPFRYGVHAASYLEAAQAHRSAYLSRRRS
jgi:5-methyltetrahydropteroyltriglutamate--homocysteine methyltransferase